MKIEVEVKNVYGNETIYPVCPLAHKFANLLQQRTFTPTDIRKLQDCGIEVFLAPQNSCKFVF